jgi:hypothetical protein
MEIKLSTIGMEKGRQYETVITTKNEDGTNNAAPIGVICAGDNKIINRIFKGTHTLENIIREREFIVNITQNLVCKFRIGVKNIFLYVLNLNGHNMALDGNFLRSAFGALGSLSG